MSMIANDPNKSSDLYNFTALSTYAVYGYFILISPLVVILSPLIALYLGAWFGGQKLWAKYQEYKSNKIKFPKNIEK